MPRPAHWWILLVLIASTAPPGLGQDTPISPLTPPPAPAPGMPRDAALVQPRRDASKEENRAVQGVLGTHGLLIPTIWFPIDQARVAGLAAGSRPEMLTWERVYRLAWVRSHATPPPRFEAIDPDGLFQQAGQFGFDDFARFRAELVAAPAGRDPAADFLDLQARLRQVETTRWGLGRAERITDVINDLVDGEASGLGRMDLDQAQAATTAAGRDLARLIAEYRDRLDLFKVSLGLSPRAAVTVDAAPLEAFEGVFRQLDAWMLDSRRELADLNSIVDRCPPLGDVTIEGRPVLAEAQADPNQLEAVLALATRFALGNRHGRNEAADAVELRVRRQVRRLIELRGEYQAEQRALIFAERLVDQTYEQIISPPAGAARRSTGDLTTRLMDHTRRTAELRGQLVTLWATFQAERLAADRDLGLVIATDWPTFLARFTAQSSRPDAADPAPLSKPILPADPLAPPLLPADPIPIAPPPPPVPLPAPPGVT